ncbi:MAG: hypothetical protein K2X93_08440 [Candidatus Obscuribacterales bacterium]|nr:hypothetical protein [Candidatus Obscuribacterales bacterium]
MKCTKKSSIKTSVLATALVLSQLIYMTPLAVMASDSTVRMAGQPVISNLSGAGSLSGEARAEQVQQNLDNALVAAKDRTPASVNITYVKGLPVITLGGYQVITVDSATAKANGATPAVLAQKWADQLRASLRDQASIQSYIAQLSGDYAASAPAVANQPPAQAPAQGGPGPEYFGSNNGNQPPQQQPFNGNQQQYGASATYNYTAPQGSTGYTPAPRGYRQGRVAYAPAGLVIPAQLSTSIATQVARPGDMIQAGISQAVILGDSQIPAGSVLLGQVTEAKKGGYLGMSGRLEIQFNRLRTPDGTETPIVAHIVGGIGKYDDKDGNGELVGETWKGKTVQAVGRGAVGAGLGAALGTAVGAIAGGGRGVGRGAWSGTAIGGGVGVVQSLTVRKGKDVNIPSGTPIQIQLDAPSSIAGAGPGPYVGAY